MDELNVNVDDVGKKNAVSMDGDSQISKDLPFLVTHWLANYRSSSDNATESSSETTQTMEYRKAMAKIRQATSDLASAFTTLGAFGTSSRVSETRFIRLLYHTCVYSFPSNNFVLYFLFCSTNLNSHHWNRHRRIYVHRFFKIVLLAI